MYNKATGNRVKSQNIVSYVSMVYSCMIVFTLVISCRNNSIKREQVPTEDSIVICDIDSSEQPKVRNYKTALKYDILYERSLDWFLQHRQSSWRDATAWFERASNIDSSVLIRCISDQRKKEKIIVYIPNKYYTEKEYNTDIRFYIINNSYDTLKVPRIDATVNFVNSSVSSIYHEKWLGFQETTHFVECGNSYWTMQLNPRCFIECRIESNYINIGDTTLNYRIDFLSDSIVYHSNAIKINLMKNQLNYIGHTIE